MGGGAVGCAPLPFVGIDFTLRLMGLLLAIIPMHLFIYHHDYAFHKEMAGLKWLWISGVDQIDRQRRKPADARPGQ